MMLIAASKFQGRVPQICRETLIRHEKAERYLGELASGPAIFMLAYLYVSEDQARQICTSALATVGGVPHTTGLRYIKTLAADRLIICAPDDKDRRRRLCKLTPQGIEIVESVFAD